MFGGWEGLVVMCVCVWLVFVGGGEVGMVFCLFCGVVLMFGW